MKNRLTQKTPKFFRRLRNIAITVTAVGTAIITAPVTLPAAIVTIGGYLIAAGTVAAAVSQATVIEETENKSVK